MQISNYPVSSCSHSNNDQPINVFKSQLYIIKIQQTEKQQIIRQNIHLYFFLIYKKKACIILKKCISH